VQSIDWGTMYAAYRLAQPGHFYYRHFVMPFWTLFPNGPLNDNIIAQAWVPMDDTNTMSFNFSWKRRIQPLSVQRTGESIPLLNRIDQTIAEHRRLVWPLAHARQYRQRLSDRPATLSAPSAIPASRRYLRRIRRSPRAWARSASVLSNIWRRATG
jgi:hypothetical protein